MSTGPTRVKLDKRLGHDWLFAGDVIWTKALRFEGVACGFMTLDS